MIDRRTTLVDLENATISTVAAAVANEELSIAVACTQLCANACVSAVEAQSKLATFIVHARTCRQRAAIRLKAKLHCLFDI